MLSYLIICCLRTYQLLLSPFLPPSCRYAPSCSDYMIVAVRRFGVLRGGWLGVRRMCRCHPWGGCGLDPVPGSEHTTGDR
jgi:uncharacterized protein